MKKFGAAIAVVVLTAVVMVGTAMAADAATYPLKKISPQEVAVLIETQRPIAIIDVRSLPEFMTGHIPAAISIPMAVLADAMTHSMIPDENKVIIVYGASEKISQQAGQMLCDFGYKNVYRLVSFANWNGKVESIK